jgi:hypothetical protein
VRELTIAQVGAFLTAIERHERERRLGDAVTARMAQADGKAWKAYVKGLRRGG